VKIENSTEDDTFRMLKSITEDEAFEIYNDEYIKLASELGHPVDGLPIALLRARLDPILSPYGWSHDKLFKLKAYEGNIS
jgi:hypothetical protein